MTIQATEDAPSYKYYLFQLYLGSNKILANAINARARELKLSRSEYLRQAVELEVNTKTLNPKS